MLRRFKIAFNTIVCALLIIVACSSFFQEKNDDIASKQVDFEIKNPNFSTYQASVFGNVFVGSNNSIIHVSSLLEGLTGIKMPYSVNGARLYGFEIKFKQDAKLLIGIFNDSLNTSAVDVNGFKMHFEGGIINSLPVMKNAMTVAGMPAVDVYEVAYKKGTFSILPDRKNGFVIIGAVNKGVSLPGQDAHLPDGRMWDTFMVEGYGDSEPLFEIVGGPDMPMIDSGMAGTEDIRGGFEAGACVKIGDTYHVFPTERAGENGMPAYFDRVKTRIGHWTSKDCTSWTRNKPLYVASGVYAVADEDNPLNDRRGAIWSYTPVFNKAANKWYGYYLCYTVSKQIEPNHSFGRIWRCESTVDGLEGIAGPYKDMGIVMQPGLDTQLWEGRQGVDSFFPYFVNGEWLALYGGAYPFKTRADYPYNGKRGGWFVGLAKSKTLEGPWQRMDTTVNPIVSMHPWFIENPLISQLPNGLYIAIFDGGPESLHLPNIFGYSLSKDGIHWSQAHYFPIETKVKKWWDTMRTPLCLIPGENGLYTMLYTAIDSKKRFRPMGMVQVKLNQKVLDQKMKELDAL